jgi:hypothetical protein
MFRSHQLFARRRGALPLRLKTLLKLGPDRLLGLIAQRRPSRNFIERATATGTPTRGFIEVANLDARARHRLGNCQLHFVLSGHA